ncbi:MAG: ribonuclease H-like domain-containing protein [Marmoricola sp.]
MTDASERALAQRFVDWLRSQRAEVERAGGTLKVFHWSHPESSKLRKILGTDAVADLTDPDDGVFCDVEQVYKSQFVSLRGTSIKKVAPIYDFQWRASDPGGAISQTYYATAISSTDPSEVAAAKTWLLTYNEDDCAAMAAIRDGMSSSS